MKNNTEASRLQSVFSKQPVAFAKRNLLVKLKQFHCSTHHTKTALIHGKL